MTRPSRRSTCRSARRWLGPRCWAPALARATPAAAQACCTGGALVSPVRLAPPEDYAVGLQTRARSDMGSFGARRQLLAARLASTEQDLEQDLAASFRLARRAQVGFVLPYVETHRTEPGVDDWGSGIGDSGPERPLRLQAGRRDAVLARLRAHGRRRLPDRQGGRRRHQPRRDRRHRHRDAQRVAGGRPREGARPALRRAQPVGDLQRDSTGATPGRRAR